MDYKKLHENTLLCLHKLVSEGRITEDTAKYICSDFILESEDEKERQKSSKAFIIERDKWYMCIKNMEMSDGSYAYIQGHLYKGDGRGCLQNEQGGWFGSWEKSGEKYFRLATNKELFEKQGKQKPFTILQQDFAPNTDPKFKHGYWVVRGDTVAQILDIQEQYYVGLDINGKDFTSSRFLNDSKIHLWTIQDAKDGDVLVDEDNNIGIYKEIEGICWHSYIYLGCDNRLYGFKIGGSHIQNNTKPATKEQRDMLFARMKEAEYELDEEVKALSAKLVKGRAAVRATQYALRELKHGMRIYNKIYDRKQRKIAVKAEN